ncbi:MAG: GNAT family N-acetyltransferase, partial [Clostridia bacterium]
MGRNASAIDEKLTAKINTISNELEGYLKNNKDLVGCRIDLTEPFKTGGRAYLHPHLLAVSGMATDWLIAHSGIRGGEGKYIYMRRAFFEDIDINILKDVLVRQLEYLREKYNAFRHDKPAPEWMVDVKEELLNAVKPLIRDELEEVRRYDVRISSEYALDKDVVANAVKQITLVSESDGLKDFGPIQKLSDDIKTFQIFIENHDLFQAISIWGKISYEIKLLEERPDEKGEIIKGHPNMMMFKGLASGVNAVVEKYISANGLINKNGILSGKSVGRLVIVTDPDKVMASLAAAKGDEIWVIPYLPARSNIFEGQGLIISIDGDEHSKDTAIEKGIPFAIVPNGVELLKNLNDKLCMMRVEGDGSVRVRLATDQEIKEKDVFVKIPIEKVINIPPAIIGKNLSYDLSDTCESHLQFIGSKSTNAGMMQNEGIPVPEGFALTFAAWNVFETHNAIGSRIEELRNGIKVIPKQTVNAGGRTIVQAGVVTTDAKELSQTLASIREIIINGEMPKEVETEILKKIHALREKYEEIYGKDFSFYVRSSFNFEDLPEEKAAGHYESYPNGEFRSTVTDHEILKAVKLVWASKWNEAAFRLRGKEGISDDTVLPGVLIQIPIKAAIAGKMSTAHVVAESRNEIEIKASRGQGSGVVDKHGAPALAIINKYSKEVEIRNSRSDVDTEDVFLDGTMETRDTTADGFKSDILTEDLCRALAEKGEDIETIFGGNPQDIEWVIDRSGRVWFVQSRPMPEFKSYEVAMMGGLLHKSYLDDVLGLIKEEALEEAARYKKEADIDGLISMLKSVKGKSGENTALWHMVFSYLNMLVKNPAVKEKITAEQLDEIVTFTKENLNTAFVTDMCITFLSSIDNDISRGAIKEFFKSAFVDISRGAIFHLTRLAAVKGFVKHDMAEEVLAMTERLYKDNYEKDKAHADKILVSILDFRDPRIVPLLRKFQSDYTGDIQEAATRMINRIESQPAAQVDRDGLGERGSVPVGKAILLGALAAAGLFIYHIFSIPAWLGPVTITLAGAVAMARFVKWQDMPDPFQKPKAGIFKGVEVVEIGVGNYFPSKLTIRKDIWDELSKTPEDIENLKLVLGTDIEKLFESWAVFKNENHGTRIITTGNGVEGVIYVSLNTPIMIDGSRISILKVTGALPLMKKDFILNHSQGAGNERLDVILDKSGQPCLVAAPAKIMPTGAMLASDAEEEASVLIECEPKKPEDKVLTDLYVGHGRYSGNFFRRKQDAPKTDIGYLVTGLEGSWMDSDYYLNPSFIPGNISVKNLEEQGAVTAMPKTTRGTFGREIDQGKILYRTLGEHMRILHDAKRIRHGFPSMLYQNETIGLKRLGDGYLPILRRFAAGFDSDAASPKITGSIDMRAAQRFLDIAVIIYEATENGYTDCVEPFLEGYFNHLDRRNDLGDAVVFDEMLNQCLDRGSTGLVTGINMMLEKEIDDMPLTIESAYFGNILASLAILEEGRDDLPPAGPSSFGKIGPAFLGVLLALSGTILPAVILLLRELRDTKFGWLLGVLIPTLSGGMFIVEPGRTVDPALLISSQTPVERALEIVKYREGMNRGVVRLLHLRDDKAMFRGFCPIAGEHDGIVDFIDLVEEADLRGPYPILVINFDPHHDAYEVDKDIVHKGNWKTHVEKRGSAIVVTVPVADGMDTKGGLSGKDGNMLPPRGSVDPIDSRDLSAQDYARIPELKDLTVTLPDGSSRRIQDYPGMIWVSMDFDTWSLTRHKQGITYHLNPEKVSEQMAYIADYFKIHGIAVDEMLGFQSYDFLDGGDNKDVWLESVGRLFRKRRGEILQPRPALSGKSRYHPDGVVATFTGTKEFSWQSIPDEYLDDDIRMLVMELARLSGKDIEDIQYQDFNDPVFECGNDRKKSLAGMLNFIEKRYPDIKTSGEAYRKVRRVLGLKVRQEYESWSEVAKIIFGDKTTPGMAESRYIEDYVIENGLTRGEMAALVDLAKEGNEAAVRTIMRSFYTKISKFIRYYEGKFVGENRHGSLDSAVLEDYIEKRFKTVILKADPESEQFDYLARNTLHDVSRQFVQRKTRKVRIGKEPLSFLEAPEGDDEFEHTILAKGSSPVTRMFAEDIRRVYDGALRALGFSALDINIYFEHEFDGNSFDLIAARRKDIAASMPVKTKYPTTKWAVILRFNKMVDALDVFSEEIESAKRGDITIAKLVERIEKSSISQEEEIRVTTEPAIKDQLVETRGVVPDSGNRIEAVVREEPDEAVLRQPPHLIQASNVGDDRASRIIKAIDEVINGPKPRRVVETVARIAKIPIRTYYRLTEDPAFKGRLEQLSTRAYLLRAGNALKREGHVLVTETMLAEKSGVSRGTISMLRKRYPDIENLFHPSADEVAYLIKEEAVRIAKSLQAPLLLIVLCAGLLFSSWGVVSLAGFGLAMAYFGDSDLDPQEEFRRDLVNLMSSLKTVFSEGADINKIVETIDNYWMSTNVNFRGSWGEINALNMVRNNGIEYTDRMVELLRENKVYEAAEELDTMSGIVKRFGAVIDNGLFQSFEAELELGREGHPIKTFVIEGEGSDELRKMAKEAERMRSDSGKKISSIMTEGGVRGGGIRIGIDFKGTLWANVPDIYEIRDIENRLNASPDVNGFLMTDYMMGEPRPDTYCILARYKGVIIGYAVYENLRSQDTKTVNILHLAVDPEYQGRGVAKAIIDRLKRYAQIEKYDRLRRFVSGDDRAAINLFKEREFEAVDFTADETGEDRLVGEGAISMVYSPKKLFVNRDIFGAGMIPVVRLFMRWAQNTPLKWIGMTERGQAFWEQIGFTALTQILFLTNVISWPAGTILVSWIIFYEMHYTVKVDGIRPPPESSVLKIAVFNLLGSLALLPLDLSAVLADALVNPGIISMLKAVGTILVYMLEFVFVTGIHYTGNIEYLASEKGESSLELPDSTKEEIRPKFLSGKLYSYWEVVSTIINITTASLVMAGVAFCIWNSIVISGLVLGISLTSFSIWYFCINKYNGASNTSMGAGTPKGHEERHPRSAFASVAMLSTLTVLSGLVIFSLPHIMPYAAAITQLGPATFLRDWL